MNVPLTGDWQNWTNVINDNIYIEQGVHILTFHVVNSGFNINKIVFTGTPVIYPDRRWILNRE